MSTLNDQEVTVFVGKKAGYYLQKWRPVLEGTGNATGFNWAAFFLSGVWLPYRKMYPAAVILLGIIWLEMIFNYIVFLGFLDSLAASRFLDGIVSLIVAMVCGGFGNAWYLSRTRKAIAKVRSQGLAEDVYLQALAKRGGTSLPAALGFLVLFILTGMYMVSLEMVRY